MSGLKFDEKGLIPVIVQDSVTNEVLMMAFANQEAYDKMIETGKVHFFSRSRQKLWMKGETSGNVQDIISIQTDCDSDCLLVRVRQTGVACHLNRASCFADVVHGDVRPALAPPGSSAARRGTSWQSSGYWQCRCRSTGRSFGHHPLQRKAVRQDRAAA